MYTRRGGALSDRRGWLLEPGEEEEEGEEGEEVGTVAAAGCSGSRHTWRASWETRVLTPRGTGARLHLGIASRPRC